MIVRTRDELNAVIESQISKFHTAVACLPYEQKLEKHTLLVKFVEKYADARDISDYRTMLALMLSRLKPVEPLPQAWGSEFLIELAREKRVVFLED
jgi:hypothetical protein